MKSFKKTLVWFAGAVIALTGLTACQDDIDAPNIESPVAKDQPNTTILELKQAYWNDAVNYADTIGTREDGSHYIISGRVVSSDEAGNVFKSLVIQDETAAIALSINSYNLYLKYRRGQEIVLDVTGMYIGKYNGLVQLGMPEWYENGNAWEISFMSPEYFNNRAQLNGLPELSKIDTLQINSFAELPTNPEGLCRYQSRLVRFNNVKFVNGGKETFSTYHSSGVNQVIEDADGTSLNVRTSGYANFWNRTLPEDRGDLVCILSYYGTTGWQLTLIDYQGCMNFGNPTEPEGTKNKPWTVDQVVTMQADGKTPSGWVTGYIVGAVAPEVTSVTSNEDIEWTSTPVLGNTLVIGQTPDTKDIAHALVIELPDGSKLAQYGNLVDNPTVYGKQIWLHGTMDAVMDTYGISGNTGAVDYWRIEGVNPGGSSIPNGEGTKDSPYSAAQVISGTGSGTTAWVSGYIVGSSIDKSASDFKPGADGASGTNIFIANTPDETDYTKCVPVQLPVGDVRSQLNLASNPGNLGKVVHLYGSLEKYFGQPGVKSVTEFSIEGYTPPTPPVTTGDGSESNPFTVAEVIAFNPQSTQEAVKSGVWVKGVIVGWADMSTEYVINTNTARFSTPATMATNILVAPSAGTTDVSQCIGVQLPSGSVRSALNLVDNPTNLGKEVLLKGDIMKYSGVPGLKNTSEYKIDGAPTPPTPSGDPVTSIDEKFSTTSIPAGWTKKIISGDKDWYFTSYQDNGYAAMTGYKGTQPPFDSWLMTPAIDMSKVADKKLTFDTQVNGYGSTTTKFEVYVMTSNDPAMSTNTRLNAQIATAPASGYSSWVNSGEIDLSAFNGTIYIGFRYNATSDANYATWCVDNVSLNAGGTPTPPTPPTPSGDYKGDFNSFNGGAAKASPYGTYTNATGWTATNAIILGGGDTDSNPYFTFIGASGTLAPTIKGTKGAEGSIVSPTLTGSIKTLTFKYGFAFAESKAAFTVNVKDASGNVVKTQTVTLDTINKATAYDFSMDVNYTGTFTIEIVNNGYSGATQGNKDRVSIWNLTWTE